MQPFQVRRQTHDGPLAPCFRFAAETEAAEAEHGFDPPDDRFDDGLAPPVACAARLAREARRHALRRFKGGIERHVRLAVASQRDVRGDLPRLERLKGGLITIPGIGQDFAGRAAQCNRTFGLTRLSNGFMRTRPTGLFGSEARHEAGPDSDLDLLVDMAADRSLLDPVGLGQDLEDLLGHEQPTSVRRGRH